MAINLYNENQCCGCSACANICKQHCIEMIQNNEGFLYPKIDFSKCVECKLCESVCPLKHSTYNNTLVKETLGIIAKDDELRKKSSSGGLFSLLANLIILNGGVVFGAAYSEDYYSVYHIGINSIDNLNKLRTSKYLQSDIADSFKETKKLLESGVSVLFSGTPCQINGLKGYLLKDYQNLYCVDVICHGVPSSKVWKKYLKYREDKNKGKISYVNMRCKKSSWQLYEMKEVFNKKIKFSTYERNTYFQMFFNNLNLRESCYNCKIKDGNYLSDLTIGDFWGVKNVEQSLSDEKGTSLAIINSPKGKQLLEKILDNSNFKYVDFEKAVYYNKSLVNSANRPKERDKFYEDLNELSFKSMQKKYCKQNFLIKSKAFIKSTFIYKLIKRGKSK